MQRDNLLTIVVATHFARLMLLLESSLTNWNFVFPSISLSAIYFLLFLGDLIVFLMIWFIRPKWELNIRIIGILWSIIIMTVILPTRFLLTLPIVVCIQFLALIWPRQYLPDASPEVEQEEVDTTDVFIQLKCSHCGAFYGYKQDSIVGGEVLCQNCRKSIRINIEQ